MKAYKNAHGDSGVTHYAIGSDYIRIKFRGEPGIYLYTYSKTGKTHIEKMKALALDGKGLSTYITQHPTVRNNYEKL